MQKRKTIVLKLPVETADNLREIKRIRCEKLMQKVTWNELIDEIFYNYIRCAKDVLERKGIQWRDEE